MNESTRLLLIVREPAIRVLSDYTQIMDSKLKKGVKVAPFHEKVLTSEGEVNDGLVVHFLIKVHQNVIIVFFFFFFIPSFKGTVGWGGGIHSDHQLRFQCTSDPIKIEVSHFWQDDDPIYTQIYL